MSTHGSTRAMAGILPTLTVHTDRMRANLDAMRATLFKAAADEWFDPGLAQHAGALALGQVQGLQGGCVDFGSGRPPP